MTGAAQTPQSPSGFAALAARNQAEADARSLCAELTGRERDALVLAAQGLTVREIADALCKALSTVEHNLSDARLALGVGSTVEAAVILVRAGLV